jgi:hypothetical protein
MLESIILKPVFIFIGFIISLLSFGMLFSAITGNIAKFAIPYTIGTLLSISG